MKDQGVDYEYGRSYDSLTTNLSCLAMSLSDYPLRESIQSHGMDSDCPIALIPRQHVFSYLKSIERKFVVATDPNLRGLPVDIRYGHRVVSVYRKGEEMEDTAGLQWGVRVVDVSSRAATSGPFVEEEYDFDAVIVANGHYGRPRDVSATIPGLNTFMGR